MLAIFKPKTEPPLDLAMRKISEADASLTVRRDAWSNMWEAALSVSRKDGARIHLCVKTIGMTDAVCGVALKLMRERL